MSCCYNVEDIKHELEKYVDINQSLLDAWKNVKFTTKKDGTPFKVMSKNIEGAEYKTERYAFRDCEKKLFVYTQSKSNGYVSGSIYCYEQVKRLSEDKRNKLQNIAAHEAMLEDIYVYDLDDIKEAVAEEIERLENQIIVLENQLMLAEKAYNNFKAAYSNALQQLEKDSMADADLRLFCSIKETVQRRYPFC